MLVLGRAHSEVQRDSLNWHEVEHGEPAATLRGPLVSEKERENCFRVELAETLRERAREPKFLNFTKAAMLESPTM